MSVEEPILTISVAARLLNLHPRTLMTYERMGLASPHRTNTKRRLFSISDLEHLQFVKFLTQEQGVNIAGAKILLEGIKLAQKEGTNLKKLLFPDFRLKSLI